MGRENYWKIKARQHNDTGICHKNLIYKKKNTTVDIIPKTTSCIRAVRQQSLINKFVNKEMYFINNDVVKDIVYFCTVKTLQR